MPGNPGWGRSARLPLAFVVVSLLALVIIPPILWWRMEALRDEIASVAEPARDRVDEIQFQLAREVSAARGYLLTRDSAFVAQIEQAHAAQERGIAELRPLVAKLGPRAEEHLEDLRAEERRWYDLTARLIAGRITPEEYVGRLPVQQALFEDALGAASRLGRIIGDSVAERRARIRRIGTVSTAVMVLLALAALLSTYFVARLGGQLQAHSRQLARRADEEHGLRELARSLASTVEIEEMLQRIADGALVTGQAIGAHVERIYFQDQELEVAATSGRGSPPVGTRIPYPGSLAQDVIERRAPELIPDILKENRPISRFLAETCARCSALILPLISQDEALGALVLMRHADGPPWSPDEIERTQVLADLATVALRRALTLQTLQRHTAELEESERRFRLMVEAVRDYGIFMLDPAGHIASWNTGAERIMGYRAAEVQGKHFSTFYTDEDRARGWPDEELVRASRSGRLEDQGWRVRKDGSRFWADTVLTAIRGEN
ncbi:MAG: PAS domain S-box protein, partial [Gemmatimonadetes bacterium]|nr:PAS domain S-box protein [Gemmatimonadota bacterium]